MFNIYVRHHIQLAAKYSIKWTALMLRSHFQRIINENEAKVEETEQNSSRITINIRFGDYVEMYVNGMNECVKSKKHVAKILRS